MCIYIDVESSGRNLKALSRARGYSAMDLQRLLGLESCQAVYKWFAGKGLPRLEHLLALARILDVPVEQLIVSKDVNL